MSQRTLIEFNHDEGFKIVDDPIGFAAVIMEMIRGGSDPRTVAALERFGITHVGQRHHSDRCEVAYPHHKISL